MIQPRSAARLAQLEESILRIDSEIMALSEEQRFLPRLLGDYTNARRNKGDK